MLRTWFALLACVVAAAPEIGAQRWTMSPAPLLQIGNESAPEYQFNRIANLRRLSDGRIVMSMGPDIRFFDAAGKYLSKAGGRGRGPGEYQYVNDLIVMAGDSLLTLNIRTIIVLDPQGKFVRQVQPDLAPLSEAGWFSEGMVLLPNGNMLAPQYRQNGTDARKTENSFRPVLRYSVLDLATGTVTPLHTSGGITQRYVDGRPYTMAFSPHAQQAVGSDRLFVGDNDSTRIHAFSLDGKPLMSIVVSDRAAPVTPADLEEYARQSRDYIGSNGTTKEQIEDLLAKMPVPTRYPYWGTALVDRTGVLWVSAAPQAAEAPLTWTAYDRAGKRIGSLTMPLRFTPKDIGADYVLGVARDEDGVESIVMYALRR